MGHVPMPRMLRWEVAGVNGRLLDLLVPYESVIP
jgi:hypothetical protein